MYRCLLVVGVSDEVARTIPTRNSLLRKEERRTWMYYYRKRIFRAWWHPCSRFLMLRISVQIPFRLTYWNRCRAWRPQKANYLANRYVSVVKNKSARSDWQWKLPPLCKFPREFLTLGLHVTGGLFFDFLHMRVFHFGEERMRISSRVSQNHSFFLKFCIIWRTNHIIGV